MTKQDELIKRAYRVLAYNDTTENKDKLLNDLEDYLNSLGESQ